VPFTQQVLAVLVDDRHQAIARDLAYARNIPLRRSIAVAIYALGAAFTTLGVVLDDEPGTIRA
jgi:hypothetical protein